jgi:hypothetical protein
MENAQMRSDGHRFPQRATSPLLVFTLVVVAVLALGPACTGAEPWTVASQVSLLERFGDGGRHFDGIAISEDLAVLFHQRMLDGAIVEKDYVVYQFDRHTGELLARKSHWRDDLPSRLPALSLSDLDAEAVIEGEILFTDLFVISPESDVFPLDPTPTNPCWVVHSVSVRGVRTVSVVDAITGAIVGPGIPPPSTGFSLTGPWEEGPCSGAWDSWSGNARIWFEAMGYPTEEIIWPTEAEVRSHVQDNDVTLFYELAHGGSDYFGSGCDGGVSIHYTTANNIEAWIENYGRMPFAFIGSCAGMCSVGDGTFANEFRKGASEGASVVGYCGMSEPQCATCWSYSLNWQTSLFSYMDQGWTVCAAYEQANADWPVCAGSNNCMRFQGDETVTVVPVISREEAPWIRVMNPVLETNTRDGGVAWGDYDGDGDLDLYVSDTESASSLYRNDGGVFVDATTPPLGDTGYNTGVAWADYDNDGDLDLYVGTSYGTNKLFRNEGGGVFIDASIDALADAGDCWTVAWADYDLDGYVDLFLANNGVNVLLRNEGPPSWGFTTVGGAISAVSAYSQGAAWGDYDNDGDPDLYVANRGSANRLFRNDDGVFVDVTVAPLNDGGSTIGCAWGDYDNDGDLDLFIANLHSADRLFRNDDGVFVDATATPLGSVGLGTGVAWADWDNDGDLDLYVGRYGETNILYRNEGAPEWSFFDASIKPASCSRTTWGLAFGDFNGDGTDDLHIVNGSANRLLENSTGGFNHWLHVELTGTISNASAIGARVRVVAGGISQIREVSGGSGYMSQSSLPVEFGLGATATVDTLEILWPSGITERAVGVAVDQMLHVIEGTWTGMPDDGVLPRETVLRGNYPNPFNPVTLIQYELPDPMNVTLIVHDLSGRVVRTLERAAMKSAGRHTTPWDGCADDGERVASGVYFYRLETGDGVLVKRMLLLK